MAPQPPEPSGSSPPPPHGAEDIDALPQVVAPDFADLAGLVVWRHDFATDRIRYSPEGWRMLGMQPRREGLLLSEVRALIHPEDVAQVAASAAQALASGGPQDLEVRYRAADGHWLHVLTRRVLERDAEGRPVAFAGVALDITARVSAQRRAGEAARRFELATRAAGIGHWSLEVGAERARWSEELRAIHGLAPGEPVPKLGTWLHRFVHPEERESVRERLAAWVNGTPRSLETDLRIVRADGDLRYLICHSHVEGLGSETLLFGLVIDVTERRRAELALRAAAERAALAARGAGLGTWSRELCPGAPATWDEQMWRLRGLEPRERAPDDDERLSFVHPDDREDMRRRGERSLADDAPMTHEFRVQLPDGRVRWLASRSTVVLDEAGRPARRIGVNWDVTDTHTADAARREREVAQRESQAKSKFLARMSHELRTPLNGVLGFAQLLLAEDVGEDPAARARRARVAQIRTAGEHLLTLINDVLDLASLEGGEMRIVLQPVPLAPLVAQALPLMEAEAKTRGITLTTGPLSATALADPTRLRQVLLNLLSNAVKYNRPGGQVVVEAAQRGQHAIVRVSDTGRGMSDEQVRHLFEPFNRLGLESEDIQGTGIGLSIVKALIERMGGSVHVDSAPGVGTLFELRLPDASGPRPAALAHAGGTPSRPLPLEARPERRGGTLLYVEDNPINALIIQELIARRPDLTLHVAVNGLEGVRMARALAPDLVLLDMQLPDFDGHEVLRRLRADEATRLVPVIALSANAMPEDIQRALRAGMADYWTKPLNFEAFMAAIDTLFGRPPPARPAEPAAAGPLPD